MSEWISVEKEPPPEEILLAVYVDDSAREKWLLYFRGGQWFVPGYKAQRFYCTVTHYMRADGFWPYIDLEHMPDPPEEEK